MPIRLIERLTAGDNARIPLAAPIVQARLVGPAGPIDRMTIRLIERLTAGGNARIPLAAPIVDAGLFDAAQAHVDETWMSIVLIQRRYRCTASKLRLDDEESRHH